MKLFPRKNTLFLAHLAAFLAVLLLLVNFYMLLILNGYFSMAYSETASGGFIAVISLFSFFGVALGAVLCPFFMPLPGKHYEKPALKPIVFILIIVVPNVVLRAMGAELWASSLLHAELCLYVFDIPFPLIYTMLKRQHQFL